MNKVTSTMALALLVVGPWLFAYASGHGDFARYAMLGTMLALQLCLLARPVARFALLLPLVYGAAAVTAGATDGVAALLVAVAAGVGASSSRGLHMGLLSALAATVIGSFEPAEPAVVLKRSADMLVGCAYGFVLAMTLLRGLRVTSRAVHPQTALSYAVLSSVLVLVAWLTARAAGFPHGWWLPLAVAAVGEPSLEGTSLRAVSRLAVALAGVCALVILAVWLDHDLLRLALLFAVLLVAPATMGRGAPLQSLLLTPILVLVVGPAGTPTGPEGYLGTTLFACLLVFGMTILGKWMLWTLRPDSGHAPA